MTALELHIALNQSLQKINANWKQIIKTQEIDLALNNAVKAFIETRSNPKSNAKAEGFEESQKRYDDLKGLKRTHSISTANFIYKEGDYKQSVYLPADYLKFISCYVNIEYDCDGISRSSSNVNNLVYAIPIPISGTAGANYDNYRVRLNPSTVLFNGSLYGELHKNIASVANKEYFTFTNNLIEKFTDNTTSKHRIGYYSLFPYFKDPVLLDANTVGKYVLVSILGSSAAVDFSYNAGSAYQSPILVGTETLSYFTSASTTNTNMPTELRSDSNLDDISTGYYFNKNRHKKPIITLQGDKLIIHRTSKFIVTGVTLNYIKKPRLVSYYLDQVSEIDNWDEVVMIAARQLSAKLHDPAYQILQNETRIVE